MFVSMMEHEQSLFADCDRVLSLPLKPRDTKVTELLSALAL